jgi:hypothetical protein
VVKRQTFLLAQQLTMDSHKTHQTISAITAEQVPNIKIKDFFSSLINQFNLIIKPEEGNLFHIDTLDIGI